MAPGFTSSGGDRIPSCCGKLLLTAYLRIPSTLHQVKANNSIPCRQAKGTMSNQTHCAVSSLEGESWVISGLIYLCRIRSMDFEAPESLVLGPPKKHFGFRDRLHTKPQDPGSSHQMDPGAIKRTSKSSLENASIWPGGKVPIPRLLALENSHCVHQDGPHFLPGPAEPKLRQ